MDASLFLRTLLLGTSLICITGQREVNFCPKTWTRIYYDCHKFGSKLLDFHSARQECLKMGADLVAIKSEGLSRHLQEEIQDPKFNVSRQEFWTGLYKQPSSESEFIWRWTQGSSTHFFLDNIQIFTGNGSAVWMNDIGFGVSEMTEKKPYICQRNMLTIHRKFCDNSLCISANHYGVNYSGAGSQQECQERGMHIPKEPESIRMWVFLLQLMNMYGMDQPVWVQGRDGHYKCRQSIFDQTNICPADSDEHGRTVCVSDNYGKFKVPHCPCHWDEWNDKCYFWAGLKQTTSRSFAEAVEFCHTNGSELATINSLEDFNFFRRNYEKLQGQRTYWIGKGRFASTVTNDEDSKKDKCTLLILNHKKGIVTDARIEERACSESHLFICNTDLQTDFPMSTCTEGTFKQVCYHRIPHLVSYTQVSCDLGRPLSVQMLNIIFHNTKGTSLNHGLLWNFTAPTGCLGYWIENGNSYLHFKPQRTYSLFQVVLNINSNKRLPFICVTEHLFLTTKLGIAAGLLLLFCTALSGILWLAIRYRRRTEDIYCEMNDFKPVLPPRDFETQLSKSTPDATEIHFHKNDAYEPLPENTELHM